MSEPGQLSSDRIADLLAAGARTVEAEMAALGSEGGWRPALGEWSANECVGHLIEAERRGVGGVALVRGLSPHDLVRIGIHPHVGPIRVDEVSAEWVHHDRNHVRQMLEVT